MYERDSNTNYYIACNLNLVVTYYLIEVVVHLFYYGLKISFIMWASAKWMGKLTKVT